MNLPLLLTWPWGVIFLIAAVVAAWPEWQLHRRTGTELPPGADDRGSRIVLLLGNGLALGLSFVVAICSQATRFQSGSATMFAIGISLMIMGSVLRSHCMRMLGPWFTTAVAVQPQQQLVTAGLYRWVRHPSYLASMLVLIGVALAQTNWLSLLILMVIPAATYGYRASVEERLLRSELGENYIAYMQRTRRFVPFLY